MKANTVLFIVSENVGLMNDILYETKQQEIAGLLLSMDFQRTYNSML